MKRVELEPRGIGKILDESFRLCRQNWMKFSLITVIPDLVAFFPYGLVFWLDYFGIISFDRGPYVVNIRLFGLDIFGFAFCVGDIPFFIWAGLFFLPPLGALLWAISEAYLGHRVSVKECYIFLGRKFWPLTGSLFLIAIVIGSGFLLLIIPGFIFMVWFILTPWVVGLEGIAPTAALARAKRLTENNFWRIALTYLVLAVIFIAMTSFASELYYGSARIFLETIKGEVRSMWPWVWVVAMPLAGAITIFVSWLAIAIGTIFYYDLRIRKEGFDLEMKAKELFQKEG